MGVGAVQVGLVRVDDVDFHHLNRKDLGDLRTLAASIGRNGLIHPIVVEKRGARFRLRAGARRLQASRMAGLVKVPAIIHTESLEDRAWLVHMFAIRRVADLLEDLTARAEDGLVTVEDCLNALHALLDAATAPKEPAKP